MAHPWAIGLLEGRGASGIAMLRSLDAVLGQLRAAGFSVEDAAHAIWLLDCYVYGHVVRETSLAAPAPDSAGPDPADYPHVAELMTRASGFSLDRELEHGLELILDALDR